MTGILSRELHIPVFTLEGPCATATASPPSWAELLRDLGQPGLEAPVVAVGDGALGFWAALRDVFPHTREQRCWVHKTANVLDALPKRLHAGAKAALHAISQADGREAARRMPSPSSSPTTRRPRRR